MQSSAVSFDVHSFQNSGPFIVGCSVVLVSEDTILDFPKLISHMNSKRVTIVDLVPSIWGAILNLGLSWLSQLRVIFFGGEKMTSEIFVIICDQAQATAMLVNEYGPAECTIYAT